MIVRGVLKFYQKCLSRRPYLTQAIQSGTLMGAGDVICQIFIERKYLNDLDLRRTSQFSSIGFFIGGPALRFWYGLLNRHIGAEGKLVAIKKVFIDQCVFAPSFILILLTMVGTVQGKHWESIKSELKMNYFDVLKTNYYIWPVVQLVNFYYIPLQYQVLLVQVVALFWNTYLSWKTNKNQHIE